MKLSATLRTYKRQLHEIISSNDLHVNLIASLSVLTAIAAIFWFCAPHIYFHHQAPFAPAEKRLYAISVLFLAWALKFLMIDMDFATTWWNSDPEIRGQINPMVNRFLGAMRFMKKTSINHGGKKIALNQLPCFLLLGPANAGKTAMLAHARIPYILQRQFASSTPEHFDPSENCDWWITRNAGIIDVPSKFLFESKNLNAKEASTHQLLWKLFLALIKKKIGKEKIGGIVIALPLAEIMKQSDTKAFHAIIETLAQRINAIQSTLQKTLPCTIIITKCDMIPGFTEFFAESPDDEITQPWGITLPKPAISEQIEDVFSTHFNALIKKLNQQLLSRLHQERNPMARPAIKNFPLQIETLKDFTLGFIKQLDSRLSHCILQGVYLTSALQTRSQPEATIINNDVIRSQHAVQVFKDPIAKSRAFFIKQFIMHGLIPTQHDFTPATPSSARKRYAIYAASGAAVIIASVLLGRDFRLGMEQTHQIQTNLADYHHVLQQFHNPDESMLKTLTLLDALQESKRADENENVLKRLLSYYSDKSEKNAAAVYSNALQAFLMPEIKNYFADYLKNPINKDSNTVYSVLKAYLMMGDPSHFDENYIRSVLAGILPNTFSETKQLLHHFDVALISYQPTSLDNTIISDTRKYLLSLRGSQLGDIILKSMDSNTKNSDALLGDDLQTNALFTHNKPSSNIPLMFTSKNFVNVFESEIQTVAQEVATGNWILGTNYRISSNPTYVAELAEEMRADYVKNYAGAWEALVSSIQIESPRDLQQADAIISSLTSYDSPLLKVLNNIHENTYFEPVTTASPKLFTIGSLIDKNNASKSELYQILSNLEELHDYLQPVLSAEDPKKAAYLLMTNRMQHQGEMDPITKLRMSADQSPMPIKGWINQLSNDTWHFLLKSSMRYLDTSWSENVTKHYQQQIIGRYPFSSEATDEVPLKKFTHFFGKPGIITSFYSNYLSPFVDTSKTEWTWKKLNGQELPLSPVVLHQIQQAMNIHHAFFPKDDDTIYVPFALQQKTLGKDIESIKLNINSKVIVDKRGKSGSPYVLTWPYNADAKFSSVELTLVGKKVVLSDFPGSWGWFKLVSQSYESSQSSNEIILNFSKNKNPAQYRMSTQGKSNPFVALSLNKFSLPGQLTTTEA